MKLVTKIMNRSVFKPHKSCFFLLMHSASSDLCFEFQRSFLRIAGARLMGPWGTMPTCTLCENCLPAHHRSLANTHQVFGYTDKSGVLGIRMWSKWYSCHNLFIVFLILVRFYCVLLDQYIDQPVPKTLTSWI